MKEKSTAKIIVSSTISFLIFLILLSIANFLTQYIQNNYYTITIEFLINNLYLSFIIFFISLIADIFWNISFPFNIPAPIISAISSIFIITYLYRLWLLIESIINTSAYIPITTIYIIIFWVVIIGGYLKVLAKVGKWEEKNKEIKVDKKQKKEKVEWSEVGNEFKLALYNLGRALNNAFSKKK
jgi:hypothetical protein